MDFMHMKAWAFRTALGLIILDIGRERKSCRNEITLVVSTELSPLFRGIEEPIWT
jgi:hypothetical protein